MASEIDPFSMLEVSLTVSEAEVSEPPSLSVDGLPSVVSQSPITRLSSQINPPKKKNMNEGIESMCITKDSPYYMPLSMGWRREVVLRLTSTNGKADVYYVPPVGKRCRSLKEVEKMIHGSNLTTKNFTFIRKALGVNDPAKELVRSAKEISASRRGSLEQSHEKIDSPSKKAKLTQHRKVKPKKETVDIASNVTEQTSLDVTCKSENAETECMDKPDDSTVLETADTQYKEEPVSTNVLASLNLTRVTSSPTNDASSHTTDTTSSIRNEPSSAMNVPTSTTSDPELDPLAQPHVPILCSCDMCSTTDEKSRCCWNIENVQAVKSDYQCITHHPCFEKLILDNDVLSITRHILSTRRKNQKKLLNKDTPLNIIWRYIAYKQFVLWINGCTAIGSRLGVVIPSCVVNAVRERYPERNGSYKVLKFSE